MDGSKAHSIILIGQDEIENEDDEDSSAGLIESERLEQSLSRERE